MTEDTGLLNPVWAGVEAAAGLGDAAWLAAMLEVEVALARAQARLGVVPAAAAATIASLAQAERFDLAALAVEARGAANPVVAVVRALTEQVAAVDPDAAEYVHRGGTSQDILDSAAMLLTARVLDAVDADLVRAAVALARLTAQHASTPMAGRTLTQHAVPITFGLKTAGWLMLVHDALARVRTLRRTGLPAQLGGAAGTLASYVEYAGSPGHGPELIAAFAAELGLPEPVLPWHALRTPLADTGAATAFTAAALGKIALDVQFLSRTEVAEVAEPAAEGRGISSAMPQKRNPVLATLIVAAARQAPLQATILTQSMLAEDERAPGAWHAEWQPLRELLRLVAGAAATAAELLEGLQVHPDRMRDNLALTGGTIVSERLNVALAPQLGKAKAKKVLADIARTPHTPFAEALTQSPELAALPVDLPALLDPTTYLGATPDLIDRALTHHRANLAAPR
ncbi:3-carboxy-cis,cis-muconate cycloisomerase [Actinophytocola sp.]|uniref:3-carboxy-cis,cis-muconate cycloisomerase n=1 Tax=Actinophytocola sp. TaxID=1872138 RepID=UPI002D7EEC4D|nr:3-carboxy-cis,cis-muconate cycloisomerase [Actinophytocola sp.]HET9141506.1 3-carboxy-cis,cis-muconate cycloisomerase [Actinophytocola sp.]